MNEVFEDTRKALAAQIMDKLFSAFSSQVKNLSGEYSKFFTHIAKKNKASHKQIQEQFALNMVQAKQETFVKFDDVSLGIVLPSGWENVLGAQRMELEASIDKSIEDLRAKELEKLTKIAEKVAQDAIEDIINRPLYNLEDDFWGKIKEPYVKEITKQKKHSEKIMKTSFDASEEEIFDFFDMFEDKVF